MTLALGILFWILCIAIVILYMADRTAPKPPGPFALLLFAAVIVLGIGVFGGLHIVR